LLQAPSRQRSIALPRHAPVVLAAALGVAILAWLGLTGFAWTDYDDEASHAYLALVHGDVSQFLALCPAYGGSLVLRAPVALLPGLWGGGELAVFRAVSLPCMAAAAVLGVWLSVRLRDLGVSPLARWSALALLVTGPVSLRALDLGHPEELLVATLCVAAVLAARSGRWGWAALALGLAIGAKPWAVLAIGPVLVALPRHRVRTLVVAGLAAVSLLAPIAIAGHGSLAPTSQGLTSTGAIFQPWQAFWFAGSPDAKVRGLDGHIKKGYRGAPGWIDRVSHPLIVGLSLPLTLLWILRRRRRTTAPGDELLLLALLLHLRCLLDTWNTAYYAVGCVFALVVWETLVRRRPPLLGLAVTAGVWISFVELPYRVSPDALSVLYLAWSLPILGTLAWSAFGPIGDESGRRRFGSRARTTRSITRACAPSAATTASR
jgi:hypothetical protein